MKEQSPNDNWRLQEGVPPDERWILQESEQRVTDQWSLQTTPEYEGREWQPVEYVKPRRSPLAWLLPTIISIALLAVVGYTAYRILPIDTDSGEPVAATPPAGPEPSEPAVSAVVTETMVPAETPAETTTPPPAPTEAASPAPTPVPELVTQEFGIVTSTYGVNARVAPNETANVIRILQQNEELMVLGREGDWLQLFVSDTPLVEGQPLSGTTGYAFGEFIQIQERQVSRALVNQVREYLGLEPTGEPVQEELAAPTEATPGATGESELALPTVTPTPEVAAGEAPSMTVTVNAVNGVNVRREPNIAETNVIRLLEFGTVLPAIARSADGAWVQVLLPDGLTGWVTAEFVTPSGDLQSLPLPGETPAAAAPGGEPVAPGTVITSGIEVTPPYTNVIPSGNEPAIIVLATNGVHARAAPAIEADSLGVVPEGAVLPAIARSPDSLWVQVELPAGELAWVIREAVNATPAVGALPAVEVETPTPTPEPVAVPPTPEPTPTPEPVEPITTGAARPLFLAVYEEPDSDTGLVGRIPRGGAVNVLGRNAAGDWLQVVLDTGAIGWASASGVSLDVEVTTLPVVE
ncbi:MAG TPA: SH3 domain-containing protein [Caldilineaceae bacterium]|nr:SH3 domain-containing protein [Caldilineaceae bacterium]